MGDPKKLRKKYQTPFHPWNKGVIEEEKVLVKEFGLGKKKEILIAKSFLKKYKNIAKRLIAQKTEQGEKEKEQILGKLHRLGLLTMGAELDQILNLDVKDVLNRRLQSLVAQRGLARTVKQARQFITHRHILIGDKEITSPSYLLTLEEESQLSFKPKSNLADEEHPERASIVKEVQKENRHAKGGDVEEAPGVPKEATVEDLIEENVEELGEVAPEEEIKTRTDK